MVGKLVMREESLEDLELYVDTLRNAVAHFWMIVGIAERDGVQDGEALEGLGAEGDDHMMVVTLR